jgi:hypothetical protein
MDLRLSPLGRGRCRCSRRYPRDEDTHASDGPGGLPPFHKLSSGFLSRKVSALPETRMAERHQLAVLGESLEWGQLPLR